MALSRTPRCFKSANGKFQELTLISPPEPPVPAVDLRDSPPKLQLHNGSVTSFDSPSESLIPPPEPRRPPGPPCEPSIPLPEFLVSLPESQFLTTEHRGPLPGPLVSSLNLPAALLNSPFHHRLFYLPLASPSRPSSGMPVRNPGCTARIHGLTIQGSTASLRFPPSNPRLHRLRPRFLHPYPQFYRSSLIPLPT